MSDSDRLAIVNGGLAHNPLFFGAATSEITSTAFADVDGGWNADRIGALFAASPWQYRGGQAGHIVIGAPGVFSSMTTTGVANIVVGHRTILLGY